MKKNYIALISLVLLVFFQTTQISFAKAPEVTTGAFGNIGMMQKRMSANGIVYLPDSTVEFDGKGKATSKTINKWDEKGDLISKELLHANFETGILENIEKRAYTYDSKHNEIIMILYQWDLNKVYWSENIKYEKEYDKNSNNTKVLSSSLKVIKTLKPSLKKIGSMPAI